MKIKNGKCLVNKKAKIYKDLNKIQQNNIQVYILNVLQRATLRHGGRTGIIRRARCEN
jgi:hypothetical protein